MMRTNKILLAIFTVFLLAGCQFSGVDPTLEISDPGPAECQDAVVVEVWGDLNADGVKDAYEPALQDVLVMLIPKSDSTSGGIQMKTGENGRAYFPTRELVDCRAANYNALFVKSVAGYEFPQDPARSLTNFYPPKDIVQFGLIPKP